jgi:hypothetical protein
MSAARSCTLAVRDQPRYAASASAIAASSSASVIVGKVFSVSPVAGLTTA